MWWTNVEFDRFIILDFNPYRQIPETISKKRAVTQGISRKLFPGVFQILQFWGVTQGIFRKLFPGKFHEYLPMKKIFFPKNGAWLRGFSGNFFQANFLCTYSRKSINKYLLMTSWTRERSQLASFESLKVTAITKKLVRTHLKVNFQTQMIPVMRLKSITGTV